MFVVPIIAAVAGFFGLTATQLVIGVLVTAARFGLAYYQKKKAQRYARQRSNVSRDIQHNLRQSTVPRYVAMGTARVGGVIFFYAAAGKYMYVGTLLSDGAVDGIIAYYVRDIECVVDDAGAVITPPFKSAAGKFVTFQRRLGRAGQTAPTLLTDAFPSKVTDEHKGTGISYLVARLKQPAEKDFQRIFRGGIPEIGAVVRGCLCYDPRISGAQPYQPNTWRWTQNPAVLLLQYIITTNGMGLNVSAIDLESVSAVADYCDELVLLKDGTRRPRYEMGGVYSYDDDPVDIVTAITDTFDGEIYLGPDGLIHVTASGLDTPQITITDDMVISISAKHRTGALYEYTTVTSRYSSELHGYMEAIEEAQPWVDDAVIDRVGRDIPFVFDLPYVFRHDQARRLMKRKFYDLNPEWTIELQLDFNGIELFGERLCRFVYPPLGIDGTFHIEAVAPDTEAGFAVITANIVSVNPEAFAWNATAEEGTPPAVPPSTSDDEAPQPPYNMHVVVGDASGTIRALCNWQASTSGKTQEAQYKLSSDTDWTNLSVAYDDFDILIYPLTAGADYQFRVRVVDAMYGVSAWTMIAFNATATAGSTGALLNLAADGGTMRIDVDVRQSSSANAASVDVVAVNHGAALIWTKKQYRQMSHDKPYSFELTVGDDGTYDVYGRSVGINGDYGPVSGPVVVTVTATTPPPPPGGGGGGGGGGGPPPLPPPETAPKHLLTRSAMANKSAASIWRDYTTDGVPASGLHKPAKSDVRAWGQIVEGAMGLKASSVTGGVNAFVLDFDPSFTAPPLHIRWASYGQNTATAVTVQIVGVGTYALVGNGAANLAVNSTGSSGRLCEALFDGTKYVLLGSSGSASDGRFFASFADLVAAPPTLADGQSVMAGGQVYVAQAGATMYPTLPGFVSPSRMVLTNAGWNPDVDTIYGRSDPTHALMHFGGHYDAIGGPSENYQWGMMAHLTNPNTMPVQGYDSVVQGWKVRGGGFTARQIGDDGDGHSIEVISGQHAAKATATAANGSTTLTVTAITMKGSKFCVGNKINGTYIPAGATIISVTKGSKTVTGDQVQETAVQSGGTGYALNDIVTVSGGTRSYPCTMKVLEVTAGAVTKLAVVDEGSYSAQPANPVSVTGGTGTGLTVNLTFMKGGFGNPTSIAMSAVATGSGSTSINVLSADTMGIGILITGSGDGGSDGTGNPNGRGIQFQSYNSAAFKKGIVFGGSAIRSDGTGIEFTNCGADYGIYFDAGSNFGTAALYMADQTIKTDSTYGLRIAGGPTEKLGFFGRTPIVRPDAIASVSGGSTTTQLATAINDIRAALYGLGLIAT